MYNQNNNQNNNNSMYRIPNRIFVGGIPQTASQDELREYFSNFGHVKDARIITDPRGNSKGYGFVTYESENDASKVLSVKEEELMFKDSKLNIGHAFRKKNNFPDHQQQQQQNNGYNNGGGGLMGNLGMGMAMSNGGQMGLGNPMGHNMNAIGQNNHHMSNNAFMDNQMGLGGGGGGMQHHMGGGMNGGAQMHHQMNLPGMNGFGGMGGLNGMNMN